MDSAENQNSASSDLLGGVSRQFIPKRSWFSQDSLDLAPLLLGARITSVFDDHLTQVRITEVEAYRGQDDPGSHAYRGRTKRTEVMFGPAGYLYVYFTYGMHWCMNIVSGSQGNANAVLLRAGEVITGAEYAQQRRPTSRRHSDLAQGPARFAKALGVNGEQNGIDLLSSDSPISVSLPSEASAAVHNYAIGADAGRDNAERICTGPRVGVSGPGGDRDTYPWRMWFCEDPTVSQYRPGKAKPKNR